MQFKDVVEVVAVVELTYAAEIACHSRRSI
jgi:hypothetical protein